MKAQPATADPTALGLYGFALTTALLQGEGGGARGRGQRGWCLVASLPACHTWLPRLSRNCLSHSPLPTSSAGPVTTLTESASTQIAV